MADQRPHPIQSLFTHKFVFWTAALLALVLDLATKAWADTVIRPTDPEVHEVIPGFLAWKWAVNKGAAFSMFENEVLFLAIVAAVVLSAVVFYMYRTPKKRWFYLLALGLVAGGAIGNLYDRMLLGHVRDFIFFDFDLPGHGTEIFGWTIPIRWPIFNVADMAIVGGVCALVALSFFSPKPKKEK